MAEKELKKGKACCVARNTKKKATDAKKKMFVAECLRLEIVDDYISFGFHESGIQAKKGKEAEFLRLKQQFLGSTDKSLRFCM